MLLLVLICVVYCVFSWILVLLRVIANVLCE